MQEDTLKTFSVEDVQNAINAICTRFEISIDRDLLLDYQNGHHPTLLSYEKVESSEIILPTIQKYLIGAQTFCDHNKHLVHFYDIARATRHVIFLQKLNDAIRICDIKVKGAHERIKRLLGENKYDPFDAIMFEIITAAKYASLEISESVEFIEESQEQSPDILVHLAGYPIPMFVECKRFDRNVDCSIEIRNQVREKCIPTFMLFKELNVSAVIDIEFYCDPTTISPMDIANQSLSSLKRNSYLRTPKMSTKINVLGENNIEMPVLFPSPKYYWERYGFMAQQKWRAITQLMNVQPASFHDVRYNKPQGRSSWLNHVDWECAARWRIADEDLQWKLRKLNFKRIFTGLEQLQSKSPFSTIHLWFEREGLDTIRQNELLDIHKRLQMKQKDIFSWMVFNETVLDTSPNGIPDIIEHAHFLTCSIAPNEHPFVENVFVDSDDSQELGEFGIGREMPCIDEEFRKRGWL